jgi:hypothetical protein
MAMGEEKFASLSSGLLARKGSAKPAMRRQGFMNPQGDVDVHDDDLGWNDMGHDVPHSVDPNDSDAYNDAPVPEVRKQIDQLNDDFAEEPVPGQFTVADLESELTEDYDDRTITTNGHGGLTPMSTDDSEYEEDPEDETAEIADEEEMMPMAASSAWTKPSEPEIEPSETEETVETAKQPAPPPAPFKPIGKAMIVPSIPVAEDTVPAREKVAFTLRLDKERHLKLRLASAVTNRSAQRLVTAALDQFLESIPEVEALAEKSAGRKTH